MRSLTCEVCQRTKPAVAPQGIASPLEVPAGRWKVVSLDIVTGLPKSEGSDHDCVVTFTDRFSSRWGTGADILAADPATEALCQDPRGGTWWEVEDVVATRNGKTRNGRRQLQYLVRYKGFSEAYDEWKAEKDVSQTLIQGYKALVKAAKAAGD